MKSTFYLLLTVIALTTFTYFNVELKQRSSWEEKEKKEQLYDTRELGELIGIEFPGYKLVKSETGFVVKPGDIPVSETRLNKFLDALSQIKSRNILDKSRVEGVPREYFLGFEPREITFRFENGQIGFTLGKKLDINRDFYIQLIQQAHTDLVVAFDSAPLEGLYSDEEYARTDEPYRKLKTMFSLHESFFYERKIFTHDYNSNPWKEIKFRNVRNRPFVLNIEKIKTVPAIPEGLAYDEEAFRAFLDRLYRAEAGTVFHGNLSDQISNQIAHMDIQGESELVSLTLFKNLGGRAGFFVRKSSDEKVYQFPRNIVEVFFANAQMFWEKRPFKALENLKFFADGTLAEKFQMKFSGKTGKHQLVIKHSEQFEVENLSSAESAPTPRHIGFYKLFELLKSPAEKISLITKEDRDLLKESAFTVYLNGMEFTFTYSLQQIIVLVPNYNVKFHYYVGMEPGIGLHFEEYFYTGIVGG